MIDEKDEEQLSKIKVSVWKKVLKIVFMKKGDLAAIFVCMIMLALLDILTPLLSSKVIEVFFGDEPRFELMWLFIGGYVLIALLYAIVIYSFVRKGGKIEAYVSRQIRKEAYEHLQELSLSYFDKNSAGWIMARLTSDSQRLAEIVSWSLIDLTWGLASMTGVLVMLYITFPPLALIITALIPIVFVICIIVRRKVLLAYREVRKTNSKITGSLNEGIMGSKTTKTLVLEEKRNREFNNLCQTMKTSSIRAIIRSSILWPIVIVIAYIGMAFTLSIGSGYALGVIGKTVLTVSTLYLFVNYTTFFFEPILQISNVLASLQQAQASAERVIGLIETKADIIDRDDVIEKYGTIVAPKRENWEPLNGHIKFNNVSFQYIENEVVLDNFSLDVPSGTSVALVGSTGSGKSTIINLLCRFYEPTNGVIEIDGKDYKDRSIYWLHENLGYVLQTPHLFSGTIKENIKYSKLDATDEEIMEAAKAVSAHEFIMEFEKGYDTEVGQGGSKLSVGQRQLISFARAILIDPKLLILDEATSSIDTQTEAKIQEVINLLMKGRTSFIVAHRLSTIINADIILVIKDGKVLEKGNHKELLELQGEYYSLYKNQFINEQMEKSIS